MTKAYYIAGTHWDREWYEPFQEYRMWLVQNLDEAIDRLETEPDFTVFHLDGQAVMIEDYLEIRPEQRSRLCRLLADGRLVAGPWYAMPDLWLVSGEALIRNLNLGMRTIRELGAEPMPVGYAPDLFGHIAAMPTIFAGLGLCGAVVWRGLNNEQVAAQFVWVGPDGSRVLTHKLPDHIGYGWVGGSLRLPWRDASHDDAVLREKAPGILAKERERSAVPLMYLSDAQDHQPMPTRVPRMLEVLRETCPDIEFVHASIADYFVELEAHQDELKEFRGELRTPARKTGNLYHALIPHCLSARVPLKQANDRCQALLSLWAEPMVALALAAGKPIAPGFLETAWRWLLKNQPHDSICGCSIDATHDDMPFRFHQAELLADGVRRQGMAALASPTASMEAVHHVAVWNPLPWQRSAVCEIELLFPTDYASKAIRSGHTGPLLNQFELHDADGRAMPFQVLDVAEARRVKGINAQGRRESLAKPVDVYRVAVALDLPAAGCTGLTVKPLEGVGALERHLGTLRGVGGGKYSGGCAPAATGRAQPALYWLPGPTIRRKRVPRGVYRD